MNPRTVDRGAGTPSRGVWSAVVLADGWKVCLFLMSACLLTPECLFVWLARTFLPVLLLSSPLSHCRHSCAVADQNGDAWVDWRYVGQRERRDSNRGAWGERKAHTRVPD
mmetsp:Transcript_50967/g.127802  ORF Transcript_50967/g.127802 Transcript_50967/m.127802 type:complete len:110 (+) Transcript_50967:574-903(+)